MDILNVFKLTNKKYYIFLKKNKKMTEQYLKKNFFSIKSEEKSLLKSDDIKNDNINDNKNDNINDNINEYELEKMETIIWMLKYGFNKVRGSTFKNINLSLKEFETIRDLVNQNIKILNKYDINQDWESDLNNCIEKEKKRHKNTRCFMCARKGHFAIDCRELYDIDCVYIGDDIECKYCKKIIKKNKIKKHQNECKIYYSS